MGSDFSFIFSFMPRQRSTKKKLENRQKPAPRNECLVKMSLEEV